MERESTGMKYMAANCEGSQSPPRAVELGKKKKKKKKAIILLRSFTWTFAAIFRYKPTRITPGTSVISVCSVHKVHKMNAQRGRPVCSST
jgi:hypothetical protein